jgi:hypothetical protein
VLERSARGLLELLERGMKPPLCRSCWKAEWNHVCPKQAALSPRAAQQQPIGDLRAMDDDNLRVAYNAVMAEYMRRRRGKGSRQNP